MKKTIAIVLSLVLCLGLLAGCGAADKGDKTITIAASPTPHAEILNVVKDVLAGEGWTLEITEYADYVVPTPSLTTAKSTLTTSSISPI